MIIVLLLILAIYNALLVIENIVTDHVGPFTVVSGVAIVVAFVAAFAIYGREKK